MLEQVLKGKDWQKIRWVAGLADSARSMGKPCTWGSGQQWCTGFSTCFSGTLKSGQKVLGKLELIAEAKLYR